MEISTSRRSDALGVLRAFVLLLGMGAIASALDRLLSEYTLASPLFCLFAFDLLMRRRGAVWDATGQRTARQAASRGAVGFGLGALVVMLVVGVAWVMGWAEVAVGGPTFTGLGLGAIGSLVGAARDEVLFRGAPLVLCKDRIPDRWALPFVALLGAAPHVLQQNTTMLGIAIVLLSGWVFALAVRAGRGLWMAWGAHAGWLFMLEVGTRGELLDVGLGDGVWMPIAYAQGHAAWVVLGMVALVAGVASVVFYRSVGCRQ